MHSPTHSGLQGWFAVFLPSRPSRPATLRLLAGAGALIALLGPLGCSSNSSKTTPATTSDAGSDVSVQDAPDVNAPDGDASSSNDATPDAPRDGGADVMPGDAEPDAPRDGGGSDAGDASSDGPPSLVTLPQACADCMQANCNDTFINGLTNPPCSGLQGSAPSGPAEGVPKVDLCVAVFNCMWESLCVYTQTTSGKYPFYCYCGDASSADCATGGGNGPCKTQMEYGLYTTEFASVVTNAQNTTLPTGLAMETQICALDPTAGPCSPVCDPADAGAGDAG